MSETLILLLGENPGQPVRWGLLGPDGVIAADIAFDMDGLAALAPRAADAQMIVGVLPGEQVAMRVMPSPPRVAAKFKAAAMYLLEDDLAEALDELHIAVMRHEGSGVAFAVKKSTMNEWREIFSAIDIHLDMMVPDFSLLRSASDEGVIVFDQRRMICAAGGRAFSADRPLADSLAETLMSNELVETIVAYGDPNTERFDAGGKPIRWAGGADDVSLFKLYASNAAHNDTPNLLQGAYRKSQDWRGALSPWRRAAVLTAACLVGLVGVSIADGTRSARLAEQLDRQALALHRTAFPEAANINPREHARRILSSRTAGPVFLSLTADVTDSIDEEDQIQIDRIRYNAARGEFAINLSFTDINDLEALKAKLTSRGIGVTEAGGVRRSGARYIGELQVSAS